MVCVLFDWGINMELKKEMRTEADKYAVSFDETKFKPYLTIYEAFIAGSEKTLELLSQQIDDAKKLTQWNEELQRLCAEKDAKLARADEIIKNNMGASLDEVLEWEILK